MRHAVHLHAIQGVQVLGRQRLLRGPVSEDTPLLEQHHAIADLPGELEIVRGHEQCQAAVACFLW